MPESTHKVIHPESVYDVIELIGTSTESWEDAAKKRIDLALDLERRLADVHSVIEAVVARLGFWVLVVEVASLFAEPLNFGFSLLARWVNLLTNLGDAFVLARWLYIDDETLLIGSANNPPIRHSRLGARKQKNGY